MAQEQDIAKSPVDLTDDSDYMDTGVAYEQRPCATKDCTGKAKSGSNTCPDCEAAS